MMSAAVLAAWPSSIVASDMHARPAQPLISYSDRQESCFPGATRYAADCRAQGALFMRKSMMTPSRLGDKASSRRDGTFVSRIELRQRVREGANNERLQRHILVGKDMT